MKGFRRVSHPVGKNKKEITPLEKFTELSIKSEERRFESMGSGIPHWAVMKTQLSDMGKMQEVKGSGENILGQLSVVTISFRDMGPDPPAFSEKIQI